VVEKQYEWSNGAKLEEHSRRKHKILREYVFDYINVRCRRPQQLKFRLAIVDGFAGGGVYSCGSPGSPLIFIEELMRAVDAVNLQRTVQRLNLINVECLLILNDANYDAIQLLTSRVATLRTQVAQKCPKLQLSVHFLNKKFESSYPEIKSLINAKSYKNVIFNLDPCGDTHVRHETIKDIMQSFRAAEVFFTFLIKPLLVFLQKNNPAHLQARLAHLGLKKNDLDSLDGVLSKNEWLGTAEKIVFESFQICAPYVSPFSINNPDGWRYWLIHFANSYRARQVYNNILHSNASEQAHFGRSGLNMLSYDPQHEQGSLYLFDVNGRVNAKDQLLNDIPRFISDYGDAMTVLEFYENIYNVTPAHADDIHRAIFESPDLNVFTTAGGERRTPNNIATDDIIKMKDQRSFYTMFQEAPKK
jgi:three-Cys-motif partner protein